MISGLQTLRDSAIALALRTMATRPSVTNTAWQVSPEELTEVTIRWPETYQWPQARLWVDMILSGLKERVPVNMVPLVQPYPGIVVFQFEQNGKSAEIAIDYSDYAEVN